MLFKGSLAQCVDFLARLDSTLWATVYVIAHVVLEHRYITGTVGQVQEYNRNLKGCHPRIVFHGSTNELAHFVLCPPLTAHATRHTLPELPDNEETLPAPPPLEAPESDGAVRSMTQQFTQPPPLRGGDNDDNS